METFKVRLREEVTGDSEAGAWRYALTISRNGQVISSTFNMQRAAMFTEKEVQAVSVLKADPNGIYKKVEVEIF